MLYLAHPVCTECQVEAYGSGIDTNGRERTLVSAKPAPAPKPITPGGPEYRPFPPGPSVEGPRAIDIAAAGRLGDAEPRGYPKHARSLTARALRQRLLLLAVVMGRAAAASAFIVPNAFTHRVSHTHRAHSDPALLAAMKARSQAAAWIAQWVSASADVGCDQVMCRALLGHGVASGELSTILPGAPDPLDVEIVVATPVIRNQIGAWRLAHVYAPGVLASFGSGEARVEVMVVASGAHKYEKQLRTDVATRRSLGALLLENQAVDPSAQARQDLAGGAVDTRLLLNLAQLTHLGTPISVLGFGGAGPGASPGMPLLSMQLSPRPPTTGDALSAGSRHAAMDSAVNAILRFLKAQRAPLSPARVSDRVASDGQITIDVDFGAPAQFGVLGGSPVTTTPIAKPPS